MSRDEPQEPSADAPFHVVTKPTGPACNLECEYCFYLDKADLYPERSDFRMSDETLETFVRQYIEAQPGPVVTFAWQGGEPTLLGIDFFRRALAYQDQYAPPDVEVRNCLQTNGTLLDPEWCAFLAENDFLVGISVDGPRRLHDEFRRTRADGSTFDEVMNGLSMLRSHGVEHNVLCVVNAVNGRHPVEVYEFFRDRGVEWIQFIPLVEPADGPTRRTGNRPSNRGTEASDDERDEEPDEVPAWVGEHGGLVERRDPDYGAVAAAARDAPVSDRSVDAETYGEFMCAVFDEWVRNDVGDVSVRSFDQCLEVALRGTASLCVHSETCGSQLAIEHNGDVYACDHFVDPGFERGNVHEIHLADAVEDPDQRQFGEYKREGLPPRCRSCDVRPFCHGGCPKDWHLRTPDGEPGLNYLCAGYRRFFTYVRPYLRLFEETVVEGRPLRAVQRKVRALDRNAG